MNTKQATCAERIGQELADREQYLADLYEKADRNSNGDFTEQDEAYTEINEMAYGISISKVAKVIWSGGGPSDHLEIAYNENGVESVVYVYGDWFDVARKNVTENSPVWRYVTDLFETGALI
jgi:hypothetical protein